MVGTRRVSTIAVVVGLPLVSSSPTFDDLLSDVGGRRAALTVRFGGGSFGGGEAPFPCGVLGCFGHARTHAVMDFCAVLGGCRD